jgi:hypothetical protein
MIIAATVLLFALRVFRRQAAEEMDKSMNEAMPAMPKQEVFANYFNTAQQLSPGNELLGKFRADHLVQMNANNQMKSQSTRLPWSAQAEDEFSALATQPQSLLSGQFMTQPQQTERLSGPPSTFSTEPPKTERRPQYPVPEGVQLPSTPAPQQEVIPLTPTRLWEENSEEEMTDPLLEALMHQAQVSLYIIPGRADQIH